VVTSRTKNVDFGVEPDHGYMKEIVSSHFYSPGGSSLGGGLQSLLL